MTKRFSPREQLTISDKNSGLVYHNPSSEFTLPAPVQKMSNDQDVCRRHAWTRDAWELRSISEGWGEQLFIQRNSNMYRQQRTNQGKQYTRQEKSNENRIAHMVDWLNNSVREKINRIGQIRRAGNRHYREMSGLSYSKGSPTATRVPSLSLGTPLGIASPNP